MYSPRLLFVLVILLFPASIFSQETYFNNSVAINSGYSSGLKLKSDLSINDNTFKYNYDSSQLSDTLDVRPLDISSKQNQPVHPQWLKAALLPTVLITAGTITILAESHTLLSKYTIQNKVTELFPGFNSSLDTYMQYAPLAAVFVLKAAGVRSRSDFLNQVVIAAKTELLMTAIVTGMKHWIPSERPSGSGSNSMPSGHTATAFASATILDMEYREASPWISVAGYAVATTTGIYRMANNQHWISDVLVGAGIGIFSAKVVYFTHRYHWGKKSNMVILPSIYKNGGGVSFAMIL
jgi:membrane-associated phospholipid phosphatase